MSRRAVVVAPPPGAVPRKAVVVRPAGRRPKGRIVDAVTGILGVLLLASTVVLGTVLPDEEVIDPQYQVRFGEHFYHDETKGELPIPNARTDGPVPPGTYQFPFLFEHDNIYQVTFELIMTDDVVASRPDLFRVRVIDPLGEVYNYQNDATFQTEAPRPVPSDETPLYPEWENPVTNRKTTLNLIAKPGTTFVTPEPKDATLEEIQTAAEKTFGVKNGGEWIIEVELVAAGDCPEVNPSSTSQEAAQALRCRQHNQNEDPEVDPGNPISITKVQYFFYDITVQEP